MFLIQSAATITFYTTDRIRKSVSECVGTSVKNLGEKKSTSKQSCVILEMIIGET